MNHYSSVIQTVAYRTDRTILADFEILNCNKIWTLDDIKWLKYLGGSVETGWFSSLLSVVMMITEYWLGKCVLGSGRCLFCLAGLKKLWKNFRQVFSVIAESDTGHLLLPHTILHRAIAQTDAYIQLLWLRLWLVLVTSRAVINICSWSYWTRKISSILLFLKFVHFLLFQR